MTPMPMTIAPMTITPQWLLTSLLFAVLGALLGWLFFAALRRSSEGLVEGAGAGRIVALGVFRLLLALGLFGAAVQFGAVPLLAALLGFTLARIITVRAVKGDRA